MDGDDAGGSHEELTRAGEEGVEDGLRGDAPVEELDGHVADVARGAGADGLEEIGGGLGAGFAVEPAIRQAGDEFEILAKGAVGRQIGFRGVLLGAGAVEQGVGEGAQDGFGVLPADDFQRAEAVGDVDGFVADVAKIARAIPAEDFEEFVRRGTAGEGGDGGIGGGLVPVVEGLGEGLLRAVGGWEGGFVDGSHRPIAGADVLGLRGFELVDGPEDREPAVAVGGSQAGEVGGVDDEDGVEFEADRSWLDVAHAGEKEGGEDLPVGEALVDAGGDFLQNALARGVFEEADDGFDVRVEADHLRVERGFGGGDGGEAVRKPRPVVRVAVDLRKVRQRIMGRGERDAKDYLTFNESVGILSCQVGVEGTGEQPGLAWQ